jgi:hypothetical protein
MVVAVLYAGNSGGAKTGFGLSYGGSSMALSGGTTDATNSIVSYMFTLSSPGSGSRVFSLSWSGGGNEELDLVISSWNGVSSVGGNGPWLFNGGNSNFNSPHSLSLSPAPASSGNVVVDSFASGNVLTGLGPTVGTSLGVGSAVYGSSYTSGAQSSMAWSWGASAGTVIQAAIELVATGGGGGTAVPLKQYYYEQSGD